MKNNKAKITALLLILASLTTTSFAIAESTSAGSAKAANQQHYLLQPGFYIGGFLGGRNRGDTPADDEGRADLSGFFGDKNGATGEPFVGYRLNDLLAFEAGYLFVDDLYEMVSSNSTDYPTRIKIEGPEAAVIISKPFANGFSVFVRPGIALMYFKGYNVHIFSATTTDINQWVATLEIGGGVNYYFTPRFAVGLTASYIVPREQLPYIVTYGVRATYTIG